MVVSFECIAVGFHCEEIYVHFPNNDAHVIRLEGKARQRVFKEIAR